MTKKVLYIAMGAMLMFGLLFLLWSWIFSGKGGIQTNGLFGTSTDATQNVGGGEGATNGQQNIDQNSTNGTITLGNNGQNISAGGTGGTGGGGPGSGGGGSATIGLGGGSVSSGGGATIGTTGTIFTPSDGTISGATWVDTTVGGPSGGGVNSNGGPGFNPSAINQVADSNPSGSGPTIVTANNKSGGLDLGTALIALGIGTAACTAGLLTTGGGIAALTAGTSAIEAPVVAANKALAVPVTNSGTEIILKTEFGVNNALKASDTIKTNFLDCITRALARAALQQITSSVVNWIKGGFNGSPSFVTNPKQFFTNIADQAAGSYIQGSALSFLCSPFALQIKIAVAQSYANKNAQSCTLSKVIKNVNSFMNGNFSQGGWGGLLSVTTMPTNNPYGAYSYAQIGLSNNIATAQAAKQTQLNQGGGFLTFQQAYNCKPNPSANAGESATTCQYKDVTPGSVIGASINKSLGIPQDQLNFAKSFDEIISAFMTQLLTKVLYSGLANVSGDNSYLTPDQQLAQTQSQALLGNMQASVQIAQQYGATLQGSIADLQNAQANLNAVAGCWSGYASTSLSDAKQSQAFANSAADMAKIADLQTQVDSYNNLITRANEAIGKLQQLESAALSVNSTNDVANISDDYTSAQNSGELISSADLTNAQQNRATLQSSLSTTNQATEAEMAQCRAFGQNAQ